jgi:transcriptional regulator with XRE-family HTH domain
MKGPRASNWTPTLGSVLRAIRHKRKWSLAQASQESGLSVSTWSKIENGQRSLTYDKLVGLARALSVDISYLFSEGSTAPRSLHGGRRSVQHDGQGFVIQSGVYTYRFLAQDLMQKRFCPVLMDVHAHSVADFEDWLRHEGDEFGFVIQGKVELHTEVYEPLSLKAGDCVYFDSSVGHAYINAGSGVAQILCISCNNPPPPESPKPELAEAPKRAGKAKSTKAKRSRERAARQS